MSRSVDDDGNDVDPGQPGELIVRGDIVTKGYFNNPAATAESFRDGWFYSGDVAIEKVGKFYIVDRKKVESYRMRLNSRLTPDRKYSSTRGCK